MTTVAQDNEFGRRFAEDVVEWVGETCDPVDVFGEDALIEWAKNNLAGVVKPDDIFSDEELYSWATAHGMEYAE